MWETLYGMVLAYPIVCFVFVPVYFSLGITSVYQYLDLRFKSRLVRCLASGTYIVRQLLNQGVTVFTPCVALNTVIGIPYWASIFGITLVSIIFTILVSSSAPRRLLSFNFCGGASHPRHELLLIDYFCHRGRNFFVTMSL
jgi:Na+/proline symporter